ncbi:MAG TPA: magnesium transporter [Lacipirellula sp.]
MNEDLPTRADSAGSHLVRRVPMGSPEETTEAAIRAITGRSYDSADAVYVIDPDRRLLGVVPLVRLLSAPPAEPLHRLMLPTPTAEPGLDQERAAALARRHGLAALPVVDPAGRLLGCIPGPALLAIGSREHAEDISRLAGIIHDVERARTALEEPPIARVRDRLPWLLGGLVGAMAATAVVARFESAIAAQVSVAFFIPAIVYLADAIGTQTESVAVRGLSLSHRPLARLLGGEITAGAMIGLVLGLMAGPCVYFAFGDIRLAVAVGLSILVAGSVATVCGLLLPWLLSRTGFDPAFGSGPIATVIQDVLSLVIYFLAVVAIMPG